MPLFGAELAQNIISLPRKKEYSGRLNVCVLRKYAHLVINLMTSVAVILRTVTFWCPMRCPGLLELLKKND